MKQVLTAFWIQKKNLRFNLAQYILLVVVYPLSYLLVALGAQGSNLLGVDYYISYYISMAISLFINLQATSVAASNQVTIIELYKTYNASPFLVFCGQSLFHAVLILPLSLILLVLVYLESGLLSTIFTLLILLLFLVFLAFLSMVIGGLIKNPHLGSSICNFIYMLIVMFTPFYANLQNLSTGLKIMAGLNPFCHFTSLLRLGTAATPLFPVSISLSYLFICLIVLIYFSYQRWQQATAAEKINLYA